MSQIECLVARKELLTKEKELTKLRDQLNAQRRWVKVEKSYVFDVAEGKVTLAELFDGRSKIFVKHFMMGRGEIGDGLYINGGQCVGCSFAIDHVEGILVHLETPLLE